MPELPEVETIRRQLRGVLVGQTIKSVGVLREKSFQGNPRRVVGRGIVGIGRKGKMLMMELSAKGKGRRVSNLFLLIHLKMTGQLVYQVTERQNFEASKLKKFRDRKKHFRFDHRVVGGHPTHSTGSGQVGSGYRVVGGHPTADWVKVLPSSHTRVVIGLSKGTLFFNDMRVFGWMRVANRSTINKQLTTMPDDVIDREMNSEKFWKILQRSRRAVKLVVMDSTKIGGVGNIYANDGLWKARIDPRRPANLLERKESDGLLVSLKGVMRLGIKYGGATASDDKFVQATGLGGKYQERFLVYEREGEKCKTSGCAGVVRKIKIGGRGTYYCGNCQK